MAVSAAMLDHAVTQPPPPSLDKSASEGALSSLSSLPSSPRQYPTDLSGSILEEGDESASESPNEPVTPVSGRQSQDFHALHSHDIHSETNQLSLAASESSSATFASIRSDPTPTAKAPLLVNTAATPPPVKSPAESVSRLPGTPTPSSTASALGADADNIGTPLQRRSTRGSTTSFKRTMSNLFRRTNSQSDKQAFGLAEPVSITAGGSLSNLQDANSKASGRRWSMNKSSSTTRTNSPPTPPSPNSPLEMSTKLKDDAAQPTVPESDDFFNKKKSRASTGFTLGRRAVNFVSGTNGQGPTGANGDARRARPARRRASSFDYSKQQGTPPPATADPNNPSIQIDRSFWAMPADAGTGLKARRMSLSLPDDFFVDVADLQEEFEYQHKFLGRHGKHIGKGATSKVTLMSKKGFPGELYAVKEFRGKSSSETKHEYDTKVKSEYSIAKSLHHPNIVETIRLCTDHGRWDHVMEYCSEGDLFSLVQKGYLKKEEREKDRTCLFKQLIQGVNYLHSNGIAHRDIKLENLLITKDSKLKITDFGVSEVFCGIHPGLREAGGQCGVKMAETRLCKPGICGSEPYIAPEVLNKKGEYDPRPLDVWSSAIVMVHLIFGGAIWMRAEETPNNAQYNALVRGWTKWNARHGAAGSGVITDTCYPAVAVFDQFVKPPALRRVLLQMLNPDPARRMTMADVVANRWVRNVECCQLESYDDPLSGNGNGAPSAPVIDAAKKSTLKAGTRKIFCHNHLPPAAHTGHSLGKMPGTVGY